MAGSQASRAAGDWKDGDQTYKGMVEVSKALMKVLHAHFGLAKL